CDRLAPELVMFGFLVPSRRLGVAIDFDQDETGRVGRILEAIEAGDARLLETFPRVGQGDILEGCDGLWFDLDMNMHNEHKLLPKPAAKWAKGNLPCLSAG